MRKLKFRAYDEENQKMIYSDYDEGGYYFSIEKNTIKLYRIDEIPATFDNPPDSQSVEVSNEPMLFIGFNDKNNKEIYAGDIINFDKKEWYRYFGDENSPDYFEEVIFDYDYLADRKSDFNKYCTVVGNKFENPELLNK